ncbi:Itchy like E3 ubiquitin protein ligase [Spraguea lophii 42_110]|uniref:HECT-type E3 ubiquitin transferase n=1 Tax=Spraguea lophii (strain 42_110) TaxID=1358809 RepID=S7W727_SPRLO|nr:Itchy like E3 ubiquitin protein ligase [Spraguea lophii 42_110]
MKLYLKKSTIKDTRFFSFIKVKSITIKIDTGNSKISINMKAKKSKLNTCIPIKAEGEIKLEILDNTNIIYTANIKPEIGMHIRKINTPGFKGELYFEILGENSFTYLENMKLQEKGYSTIEDISREENVGNDGFMRRIDYTGNVYYAHNRILQTFRKIETIGNDPVDVIEGWEKRIDNNGKTFYIDHYNRTTHRSYPWSVVGMSIIQERNNSIVQNLHEKMGIPSYTLNKYKISVARKFMIQSSAYKILHYRYNNGSIRIKFVDEIGEDYGGIFREFFYLASKEIAKDKRMVVKEGIVDVNYEYLRNRKYIKPNQYMNTDDVNTLLQMSKTIDDIDPSSTLYNVATFYSDDKNAGTNMLDDRSFFQYVGAFLGLVIAFNQNIAVQFSLSFYENLLKTPKYDLRKIQDPQMQKNLLCLYKSTDNEEIEDMSPQEYVNYTCKEYLYIIKREAYEVIKKGFNNYVGDEFLADISCYELNYMLFGRPSIPINSLLSSVRLVNCSTEDKEVQFLYNILKRKNTKFLKKFFMFVRGTGTFPNNPIGADSMQMYFEKTNADSKMFTATTCIYRLYFSNYESEEEMERYLDLSVLNTEGFHHA